MTAPKEKAASECNREAAQEVQQDHRIVAGRAGQSKTEGAVKPCPFCTGPAGIERMPNTIGWTRVRCRNFKCGGTTWAQPSEELAVVVWNRRDGEAEA